MADPVIEQMFARARALQEQGYEMGHAVGIAQVELRIQRWPAGWGNDLYVLLYGDFEVPAQPLKFPSLGITVLAENRRDTVIRGATTVLDAVVEVQGKTVAAVEDAGRRINLLLGAWTLCEWANAGCGWWSAITHGSGGAMIMKWAVDEIEHSAGFVMRLPPNIRKKIEAALFWMREGRNLILETYRSDVLRVYSAHWNAFECLVEAVCIARPPSAISRADKQQEIDSFLQARKGKLTAADIQDCYQRIVNPGLVKKAQHALFVCCGDHSDQYFMECFRMQPKEDRLYDIRNAINHGEIDAESVNELLRVNSCCCRLKIDQVSGVLPIEN